MLTFDGLFNTYSQIFDATLLPRVEAYAIYLMPIMAAILLAILFFENWMRYVRMKFFLSLKYTVLELKLPKKTQSASKRLTIG